MSWNQEHPGTRISICIFETSVLLYVDIMYSEIYEYLYEIVINYDLFTFSFAARHSMEM